MGQGCPRPSPEWTFASSCACSHNTFWRERGLQQLWRVGCAPWHLRRPWKGARAWQSLSHQCVSVSSTHVWPPGHPPPHPHAHTHTLNDTAMCIHLGHARRTALCTRGVIVFASRVWRRTVHDGYSTPPLPRASRELLINGACALMHKYDANTEL